MKPRRDSSAVVAVAVFALAAVACAAMVVSGESAGAGATAGAILLLAAGLVIATVMLTSRSQRADERSAARDKAIDNLFGDIEATGERLLQVEQRLAKTTNLRFDEIIKDVRSLREDLQAVLRARPGTEAETPRIVEFPPQSEPDAAPAKSELLELFLEPVIELSTGSTAHYRALLNLSDGQGNTVHHRDLMDKAEKGGMRAALDLHMLRHVLPVLRKLRNRQPGLRIFVPIGAATLGIADDFEKLVAVLEQNRDVASGMVSEIRHDSLAGLDEIGLGNLARLARLGITMSLSRVSIAALDLPSLHQLGVRYLAMGAVAFDPNVASPQSMQQFVQYARAMQFQVMAANVETPFQADSAARSARFGFGPYFAPPRRVKADAGAASSGWNAEAA